MARVFQSAIRRLFSYLLHELDEIFLMHEARVLTVLQNTHVSEAELDETLVNEIYR
jgi:hypothetical protein